ncbi:MAG: hypothetical protein BWY44_01340 [Candidatus Omnitrophica bacterium ADurb.Bin292]|nr:MAG: hypothetical protein BWY44_01340 [Candidatus Omnitrophica bacterium ADurb.Bin292]
MRFSEKHELSRKKIFKRNKLGVFQYHRIRFLLERKADIHSETPLAPRSRVSRLHNSGSGPRNHHPLFPNYGFGKLESDLVIGIRSRRSRRTKNSHFSYRPIRFKHVKTSTQFLNGRINDLHVTAFQPVPVNTNRRGDQLLHQVSILPRTNITHKLADQRVNPRISCIRSVFFKTCFRHYSPTLIFRIKSPG